MPTRNHVSGMYRPLTAERISRTIESQNPQLRHIILTLIESGLTVFHQTFSDEIIDPDLFSALITAISLGRRMDDGLGDKSENEVFEVERQKANLCYGKHLAGIAISETPLDTEFMTRLKEFINTFETEYEFLLVNWHGDITFFDQQWASTLLISYLSPPERVYRLHADAMRNSENGRQVRVILLIKRFVGDSKFNIDVLQRLIIEELQVPE
ncbi:MAG: hypothetical protein ACTSU3_02275, partial [Candidatus Thorarchaeota archaeon]